MNEVFLYVLALAARRYGIPVHAFCVLSNHAHLILTDATGSLPAFMQYLDSLVARAVNASLGRFEGFWASGSSYSAVEPLDPRDVVEKTVYVLANPVAAGLVRRGADWPGLWSAPERIGAAPLTARRPKRFFDQNGYLPDTIELALTTPAGFASAAEFSSLLTAALNAREEKHHRELSAQSRRFLGVARVLSQNPLARPLTAGARFQLRPRIAGWDKWLRIQGVLRLRAFESEYREARARWLSGLRDVLFPAGTYLLRVLYGVHCAEAP